MAGAEVSSRQFMTQYNHLGKPIAGPQQVCKDASRTSPSSARLKELLKARRVRGHFFGEHLFADAAWDILLHSYIAHLDDEQLLVSALLRASLLPATTIVRWVKALEQEGWLKHTHDTVDDPRASLRLTAAGKVGMDGYFAVVWPSLPL